MPFEGGIFDTILYIHNDIIAYVELENIHVVHCMW